MLTTGVVAAVEPASYLVPSQEHKVDSKNFEVIAMLDLEELGYFVPRLTQGWTSTCYFFAAFQLLNFHYRQSVPASHKDTNLSLLSVASLIGEELRNMGLSESVLLRCLNKKIGLESWKPKPLFGGVKEQALRCCRAINHATEHLGTSLFEEDSVNGAFQSIEDFADSLHGKGPCIKPESSEAIFKHLKRVNRVGDASEFVIIPPYNIYQISSADFKMGLESTYYARESHPEVFAQVLTKVQMILTKNRPLIIGFQFYRNEKNSGHGALISGFRLANSKSNNLEAEWKLLGSNRKDSGWFKAADLIESILNYKDAYLIYLEPYTAPLASVFETWIHCSFPLHAMAVQQDKAAIKKLLAQGYDINQGNENGTPLTWCMRLTNRPPQEEFIRYLVKDCHASLEACAPDGSTALHFAVGLHRRELISVLISEKSLAVVNNFGLTPFLLAAINGDTKSADILAGQCPALIEQKNGAGQNALHIAAIENDTNFLTFLLERGAEIDSADNSGLTAAMYAAKHGNTKAIALLIAKSAKLTMSNCEGKTALHLAVEGNHLMIGLMIDASMFASNLGS